MRSNRNGTKNLNLQGGELFIKLVGEDNYKYFGMTNEFKVSFKSEMIEHENSETDTIVTDLELLKKVDASLSFSTEDLNRDVLSIAFGGDATEVTQEAGTGLTKDLVAVASGKIYELGKHKVLNVNVAYSTAVEDSKSFTAVAVGQNYDLEDVNASGVVVSYNNGTDDVDAVLDTDYSLADGVITILADSVLDSKDITVTFNKLESTDAALDTDYILNNTFGTIEITANSVLDNKDIAVTFDNEAETIVNYSSLDNTSREFSLRFVSNPKNGTPKETIVHKTRLSLNGDWDLKSLDKFTSLNFDGKVLQDSTKPKGQQFINTIQIGL